MDQFWYKHRKQYTKKKKEKKMRNDKQSRAMQRDDSI